MDPSSSYDTREASELSKDELLDRIASTAAMFGGRYVIHPFSVIRQIYAVNELRIRMGKVPFDSLDLHMRE